MPASWSLPNLEYLGRATQLASDGYVVVSYTSRGFWDSAGQIDIAGPDTVEDVSAVIDWALAHTPANPNAIGASGISYGAGISLLAAERDPRIKAVAALSGWADLEASLYCNRTVSQQGVGLLVGAGAMTGRAGPDLAQIGARVAQGDYDGAVQGFLSQAASRSPATDVAALNARGTAVLLGMRSTMDCFRRTRPSHCHTGPRSHPGLAIAGGGDRGSGRAATGLGDRHPRRALYRCQRGRRYGDIHLASCSTVRVERAAALGQHAASASMPGRPPRY